MLGLIALFFFVTTAPARAPKGGKNSLGGRTIAALQEDDFDRKLLRYQICYGVKFLSDTSTVERRRACKAMLVNRMESALAESGRVFERPISFQCEDTALGAKEWTEEERPVGALRPNAEFSLIEDFINRYSNKLSVDPVVEVEAREACEFLTDCKNSMRIDHLSLRKIGACLVDKNPTHRKILMDEIGAMLFRVKSRDDKLLLSELYKASR